MRSIYRKKPLEVQAIQYTIENWEAIAEFLRPELETKRANMQRTGPERDNYHLSIKSLENEVDYGLAATIGDWIIRGTAGEVYPCKPHVFDQVYEHVRTVPSCKRCGSIDLRAEVIEEPYYVRKDVLLTNVCVHICKLCGDYQQSISCQHLLEEAITRFWNPVEHNAETPLKMHFDIFAPTKWARVP